MANILQRLFSGKKALTSTQTNPGFRFIGGNLVPYKTDKLTYIEKAYMYNDIIYSIVKLILDKAVQAPGAMYTIKDEQKFFEYSAMYAKMAGSKPGDNTGTDFRKMKELRHKALVLDTSDEYLTELFTHPNENETFAELNYGLWGYKLVTGDYFEAGWKPWSGGLDKGKPMQLYGLPSQFMSIIAGTSLPLSDAGYLLQLGSEIPYEKEDILHERYWNPEWDMYGAQLYGMSPLKASLKRIQRNNLVQVRGAKMAENAGADVLVSMDDPAALGEQGKFGWRQVGALKDTWDAEQAGANNAGKAVWSAYKMNVSRLGLTAVEMDLLESENIDLRFFCNAYGVPSQMVNDPENKKFDNQVEGEKALTTRCAMPLLVSRQRSINRKLKSMPAYKGRGKVFEFDMSVFTELEENKVQLVTWMNQAPLQMRRKLEILGEDIPDNMTDEELSAITLPSGTTLLADLFVKPVDPSADATALGEDAPYNMDN